MSHGETCEDLSEMSTTEKMTVSSISMSESSDKDTFAQAQLGSSWPHRSEMTGNNEPGDDSDDQMNDLVGSYREISMEDEAMRENDNDTDHEISNLSPDSADELEGGGHRGSGRPNTLDLHRKWSGTNEDLQSIEDILGGLQGLVARGDGGMVTFVAQDLQEKIKMSSPVSRKDSDSGSKSETPSLCSGRQSSFTTTSTVAAAPPPQVDPAAVHQLWDHCLKVAAVLDNTNENLTGTLHSISSLAVDCVDIYKDGVCKMCDSVDGNIKAMYQLMAKCEEMSQSMKPVYRLQQQLKEIRRLLDIMENLVSNSGIP